MTSLSHSQTHKHISMESQCNPFVLKVELKIIRAENISLSSSQSLFVRSYISDGTNEAVKLDTQQISSNSSNFSFNQTFSLDCLGTKDTLNSLKKLGTVVFELRQRRSTPRFMMNGSKLVARAEMPLQGIFSATCVEIEKCVVMVPKIRKIGSRVYTDVIKPPSVLIAMKVEEHGNGVGMSKEWDEHCGCKSCVKYEFFAIEAAMEAF